MVSLTFKRGRSPTVFIYRVGSDNALHLTTAFHPVVIGKLVMHLPIQRVGYAMGKALDGKTFSQATRIAKRMHWPRPIKEPDTPHVDIRPAHMNANVDAVHKP